MSCRFLTTPLSVLLALSRCSALTAGEDVRDREAVLRVAIWVAGQQRTRFLMFAVLCVTGIRSLLGVKF